MQKLCVITGEASGDIHGASLIKSLRKINPHLQILAAGGSEIRSLRPDIFIPMAHLNVIGFTSIFRLLPQLWKKMREIHQHIQAFKPEAVVFIDNPGFNLRLAKKLDVRAMRLYYYICPQVWAWNESRVHLMKKLFKKLFVIFDFEEDFYKERGVCATFVGHPLLDHLDFSHYAASACSDSSFTILLMPGSRKNEIKYMLPEMLQAASHLSSINPHVRFKLVQAPTLGDEEYARFLRSYRFPIELVRDDRYSAIHSADLVWVCSGTATLECLVMGAPMIIVNKTSAFNAWLIRRIIRVPFLGLPNLIAKNLIVPELHQEAFTAQSLVQITNTFLDNPNQLTLKRKELIQLRSRLGKPGASDACAREILQDR